MSQPRSCNYDLHGRLTTRMTARRASALTWPLLTSKFRYFRCPDSWPAAIDFHLGPFRPAPPRDAVTVDKKFRCAPNYLCYMGGSGHRGAVELQGFDDDQWTLRCHAPRGRWGSRVAGMLEAIQHVWAPTIAYRLQRDHGAHVVHGAAVTKHGMAIVLVGGNGTHKTPLALDLCHRHGFQFLADDWLILADGCAWPTVEHPSVLAGRYQSVVRGGPSHISPWALTSYLRHEGQMWRDLPAIGSGCPITMMVHLQRSNQAQSTTWGPIQANLVWQHAQALERLELIKHQNRFRTVVHFARLAMAYEYALPGSSLFQMTLGRRPTLPDWLQVPCFQSIQSSTYQPETADLVAQAVQQASRGRLRAAA